MGNDMNQKTSAVGKSSVGKPSRYEAPYLWDGSQGQGDRIIGWVLEAVAEGEAFLKGQRGFAFVDTSHRIMADVGFDELPPTLSKASLNFVKRDVRELVATLANPRPVTSFKCDNPAFSDTSRVLNDCYMAWYSESFADRAIHQALQFAAVEGTGYLMTGWDPNYWAPGRGEITLTPMGVDAVLPIQMSPETWDLQSAYAVIIRRQVPIVDLMRRFPLAKDRLVPDGEVLSRWRRLFNAAMGTVAATVHNTYGQNRGYKAMDSVNRALVTVYDIYVLDMTVNTGTEAARMGVPGSPWEYVVPPYGAALPTGIKDPRTGQDLTRPADVFDARMFPYRRHIVATRNTVLYDGPSKYWHGDVPLVKFALDSWPFEYCGMPLTKEPAKLQAMLTSLLRAYDDSANARLRPPIGYDSNRVAPALARSFDPRSGGQVIEMNDMVGEAFKLLVDPRVYQMGSDILPLINFIKEEGTKLMGLHDLAAMQKASQIPAGDTLEKLQEMAGPIATDMSRNMEATLKKLGEQFKALCFEFYTARRRFSLLGADGLTSMDFNFDPATLVPDELELPGLGPNATRAERARRHMENFQFSITPNTIYAMTQSTRRLMMLQLARTGVPISPYTLMEAFDINNPGAPPQGANTEIEKWRAWKEYELDIMIEQQMKMAEAQGAIQAQQMAQNPMGMLSQAIQSAVQAPTARGEGRPPSGQKPPHTEVKDGGTRVTVAES